MTRNFDHEIFWKEFWNIEKNVLKDNAAILEKRKNVVSEACLYEKNILKYTRNCNKYIYFAKYVLPNMYSGKVLRIEYMSTYVYELCG
jgi:hypothetical protein